MIAVCFGTLECAETMVMKMWKNGCKKGWVLVVRSVASFLPHLHDQGFSTLKGFDSYPIIGQTGNGSVVTNPHFPAHGFGADLVDLLP